METHKDRIKNFHPHVRADDLRRLIEKKAYEMFERTGYRHGFHLDHWFTAERIIVEDLIK